MSLIHSSNKQGAGFFSSPTGDQTYLSKYVCVILQGEVWWADLADPSGSVAGFRRPVIVVQTDQINRSQLRTVVCVPLTGNVNWAAAPTNLLLPPATTGLDRPSVAQATKILAVDKSFFNERVGKIDELQLQKLFTRIDIALGRGAR